jgi:hypothetical protein
MYTVTDDSGFLALVVPDRYPTFVADDWRFPQLLEHFHSAMAQATLLLWGTGLEGTWQVDVVLGPSPVHGVREVVGPLEVLGGRLLLTNYETLTMVAQFDDMTLPPEREADQVLSLAAGSYSCRVVQMFNPESEDSAASDGPDFVIELLPTPTPPAAWTRIPWFDGDPADPLS